MLLNGTPFAFVIDLAALASRREYLKLDKWLTDKIREHGVSLHTPLTRGCWEGFLLNPVSLPHSGTFHPGLRHLPEAALSLYNGRSSPGQGPAQKLPAAPGDLGHHAGLPAVVCWVSLVYLLVVQPGLLLTEMFPLLQERVPGAVGDHPHHGGQLQQCDEQSPPAAARGHAQGPCPQHQQFGCYISCAGKSLCDGCGPAEPGQV